jgi:hypothetical protein
MPVAAPFIGGAAVRPSDFAVVAATSFPAVGKIETVRVFFDDFFGYIVFHRQNQKGAW